MRSETEMSDSKKADRLYVDKKDLEVFNRLKEKDSPFAGVQNKDVFVAAMVTGYNQGCRIGLKNKEGYFFWDYLSQKEQALFNALAISEEGDLKVLLDRQKIFTIAEEYAAGGIALLKEKVFGEEYGSYVKKLESELLNIQQKDQEKLKIPVPDVANVEKLPIKELIAKGEGEYLEFKSTIFWNIATGARDIKMAEIIVKVISSFMNSKGGILLVGVSDNKEILGLDDDLKLCKNSLDKLEVQITDFISKCIKKNNMLYVKLNFEKVDDKYIAIFRVKEAPHAVYVEYEVGKQNFFIRVGNNSEPLSMIEAIGYVKDKWQ
jgi:hypothetical protein